MGKKSILQDNKACYVYGMNCHEKAPRGSRTGLQAIKDIALKSIYPPLLCEHIVDECEKYIENLEN